MNPEYDSNEDLRLDIQGILWWMFRADNGPRCLVKQVAPEIGISPDQLNKYITNYQPFPSYLIPGLYNATKDQTLLNWIISRCEGAAVSYHVEFGKPSGSAQDEINKTVVAIGKLVEIWEKALERGELNMTDRGAIGRTADRVIELMERIKRETK